MKTLATIKGHIITVDDADYEWALQFRWSGSTARNGDVYAIRAALKPMPDGSYKPSCRGMHRELLDPDWTLPWSIKVDHWNGNTLDNQRHNLRQASASNSMANRSGFGGHPQFKGVYLDPASPHKKRYIVRSKLNGKIYYGRCQPDEISAAREYNRLALNLHGEFARLNIIPEC